MLGESFPIGATLRDGMPEFGPWPHVSAGPHSLKVGLCRPTAHEEAGAPRHGWAPPAAVSRAAYDHGMARPIGPHSLYWQCRIQGAEAYREGKPLRADPYADSRPFSGRAWRDGWRAAAAAAGAKMPHQLAAT